MSYGGGYGADRFGDPSSYGSRAGFSGGPSGGYGGYGGGGGAMPLAGSVPNWTWHIMSAPYRNICTLRTYP